MTDLDLDAIERLHPDEPGINPFVRPLVAEVRRLRNIGSPFGIDRTLDEFRDHLAADLAGPGVRPYVDEMFSALVARTNERDEARAERDAFLAALGAIATLPSASIAVRDIARHALLNGGAA